MTEIVNNFLQYISTTSGFMVFVGGITVGYAGIWFLFLFEPSPKPSRAAEAKAEGQQEGAKRGKGQEEGEEKQAKKKKGRQPATSRA